MSNTFDAENLVRVPAHLIGVTRLGTRLITHSDPTLLTPERAEELLAGAYVDGLLSSRTRAVEVVEFDSAAFWWTRERAPQRHAWER